MARVLPHSVRGGARVLRAFSLGWLVANLARIAMPFLSREGVS
jgi:hypothetical protein